MSTVCLQSAYTLPTVLCSRICWQVSNTASGTGGDGLSIATPSVDRLQRLQFFIPQKLGVDG
ncbi:MAG: hypothetical protein RM021_031710 [Nostoc sp. EkiNYC01]|nr:hypothetical protein [Nostoc sp. EkiNYC01]